MFKKIGKKFLKADEKIGISQRIWIYMKQWNAHSGIEKYIWHEKLSEIGSHWIASNWIPQKTGY